MTKSKYSREREMFFLLRLYKTMNVLTLFYEIAIPYNIGLLEFQVSFYFIDEIERSSTMYLTVLGDFVSFVTSCTKPTMSYHQS